MRNLIRLILLALGAALLWVVFDQIATLNKARAETPALFAKYQDPNYTGPRWQDLPKGHQNIWLTVEDPSFFDHSGVDLSTPGAGITTITQGLIKRIYFDDFRPGYDKLAQTLIAIRVVTPLIDKQVQLTAALDLSYFGTEQGRDIIGFQAASQHYYNTPLERLSEADFAGLVAMLIGPNGLAPGSPAHTARMMRVFRLVQGDCAPLGLRDVWLDGCA